MFVDLFPMPQNCLNSQLLVLFLAGKRINKKSFIYSFLGLTDKEVEINLHYKGIVSELIKFNLSK